MTTQGRARFVAITRLSAAGVFAAALSTACTSGGGGSDSTGSSAGSSAGSSVPAPSTPTSATATVTRTVPPNSLPSSSAPNTAPPSSSAAPSSPTVIAYRTPVRSNGTAAAGWSVRVETDSIICSGTAALTSRSPNVYDCAPSAAVADTCWVAATPGRMLCLVDPWKTELTSYPVEARPRSVAATATPVPIGVELGDGTHCRRRVGGAASRQTQHPDWVPYYDCPGGRQLWASPDTTGIDRTGRTWLVHAGTYNQALSDQPVTRAYYARTA